ncbi:glycosyltransferase family 2 protein [Pseudomonas sp. COW5]|uniref:glycosyltransferase family 2 protein n=1 Tax=Pseudomonas sp. COW5 TaxID=2981253 RepID=UPI00224762CD|nr:glycosyltransferase family 2 protein [Pseudomonas sp. COW5]MCX2545080.1 glycosyltransferase family 2 protein [Pseudomonas sp. COW5]
METLQKIAVVIPSFKVKGQILDVISKIGPEVNRIYVVDDCCPQETGKYVSEHCTDLRVTILHNPVNLGVGGAVMNGYAAAIQDGMDIIVKVDGDGQMDPRLIKQFVAPIIDGEADYTKGNRFFDLEEIHAMPKMRLFGNAVLSFMTKLSSGYWDLFDPTNGFTAIHRDVAKHLPFHKISNRYFFETDILFRLNTLRAVVIDIPMDAKYGEEESNLKISKIVGEFLAKHLRNLSKRIFYNYYLRNMSLASIELPLGVLMLTAGTVFGVSHWMSSIGSGIPTPAGTVMLSALPIILGTQFILAFIGHDVAAVPKRPFHLKVQFKNHWRDQCKD